MLNVVDHGADAATLGCILQQMDPPNVCGMMKSLGIDTDMVDDSYPLDDYVEIARDALPAAAAFISQRLHKAIKGKSGKEGKVQKEIVVHMKNGKTYIRKQWVKPSDDAKVYHNAAQKFDDHVAKKTKKTDHLTGYAKNFEDLMSQPGGPAIVQAINKAIGSKNPSGKLTPNMNYTDIRFAPNPNDAMVEVKDKDGNTSVYHRCLFIAKNPTTGKDQYFYSEQHVKESTETKVKRSMMLSSPAMTEAVTSILQGTLIENDDIRNCLKLMYMFGMKSGNENTFNADPKQGGYGAIRTAGATTLRAENIFIYNEGTANEKVVLRYYDQDKAVAGKAPKQQEIVITDEALAVTLRKKKHAAKSGDERIFNCTNKETLEVCKSVFHCTNEDLRASFGYRKFREARVGVLGENPFKSQGPKKMTAKEEATLKRKATDQIRSYVKQEYGVLDNRSVKNLINTKLIDLFFMLPHEADASAKSKKVEANLKSKHAKIAADMAAKKKPTGKPKKK